MRLGNFEIPHPFILAPMAGITNSTFRRLMRRMGSPIVISELVSANGLEYGSQRTKDLLRFHEDERILGLQIFGENEDNLCRAAEYVQNLGADFVDLNLGCPVPKIVKKGAGSALCRDPRGLFKILDAMKKRIQIPLTIKIRTGWDEQAINVHEVIQAATDAGVTWVAIHGRTRAQAYTGEADWNLIREAKEKAKIPIIGNGDLHTAEKAVQGFRTSGVDAVLIGRGALRNPFIFRQAESLLRTGEKFWPTLEDYLKLFDWQSELLMEMESERVALIQSRKFLGWYSAGFPNSHEFRKSLFLITDFNELWNRGREFFVARFDLRSEDYLDQAFLMGGHG